MAVSASGTCPHIPPEHCRAWAPVACDACRGFVDHDGTLIDPELARRRYPALTELIDGQEAAWGKPAAAPPSGTPRGRQPCKVWLAVVAVAGVVIGIIAAAAGGSGSPPATPTPAPAATPPVPAPRSPSQLPAAAAPSPPPRPTNPETISRSTFKGTWPFTVDSGVLSCDTDNRSVVFDAAGTTYGLNGTARDHGYPDVTPIWKWAGDGLRVYLGDVADAGLALCGS